MTGKKREVNIKRIVLSMSPVSSSHLPAHGGKRQLMVPEGPVFALSSYASAGDSGRKTTAHGPTWT